MSSFTFDGTSIRFAPGQTLGAALLAAGIRSWRDTRNAARPRGLVCGIGVCFDCLVTVNGRPNQRACRIIAVDGMAVTTQKGTGYDDLAV